MKRFNRVFFTGAVLGALSFASFAHAASFVVTRFDDPAPDGCNSGVDCSLREAVIAANAAGGTNDIQLGIGTYTLTIAENGSETGGSLNINNDLTIQGQGADATIIDGVQPGLNSRIIESFGAFTIALNGLTVQHGDSNGGVGGGILMASTSQNLTLSNCRVTSNIGGNGGGLYSNAQTLIQNCRFDHNEVESDTDGGGVYFGSSVGLVVENSTFDNNELPANGQGAGLFFGNGSSLSISGSHFEANKLTLNGTGAGLHCDGNDPVTITDTVFTANSIEGGSGAGAAIKCDPSSLTLDGVTLSQNTTDGGEYAAMYILGGTTTIRNSTIEGNRITAGSGRFPAGLLATSAVSIENSTIQDNVNEGSGDGGGMWIAGSLTVTGSTFSGNQTNGNAGALQLTAAAVNISNSTFSDNEAQADGGAIHIDTGNGSFNNVTIVGNTATGLGGGVFFDNFVTFTIRNSILSGNEGDSSPDCSAGNAITSGGYNLIGSDTGCLINPPDGDPTSTDIYGADPLLGALADNGGPTETLALLTNSPAIDAGNPAGCADQNGDPLTTDQRGAPRPFGDRCDIGAFEFDSLPPGTSDLAITKTVADDEVEFGDEVTFTLTVSNTGATNTQVVAIDDLPAGLALVSATGAGADCTTSGNSLSCVAATLDDGASFTVTVVATAETVGTWENTATVSGETQEADPANNSDSVTVEVEVIEGTIGGGGCMLGGGNAPSSMLSLACLAALAGAMLLRRRG